MEEKKRKTELGHIYSCRISKSQKYLNLTIAVRIGNEDFFICVPVPFHGIERAGQPYAEVTSAKIDSASIVDLKVFKDEKPKAEEKKEEPEDPYDGPFDGAVPF